jgi:hypothetical protein
MATPIAVELGCRASLAMTKKTQKSAKTPVKPGDVEKRSLDVAEISLSEEIEAGTWISILSNICI